MPPAQIPPVMQSEKRLLLDLSKQLASRSCVIDLIGRDLEDHTSHVATLLGAVRASLIGSAESAGAVGTVIAVHAADGVVRTEDREICSLRPARVVGVRNKVGN